MLYGLIGTHRSGKTSAAKLLAEQMGIDFLDSSFDVARKFGYNPVGHMSLGERLDMQRLVLDDHLEKLNKSGRPLVTDRTPIDYFAYTMAQFGMTSHTGCSQTVLDEAYEFCQRCLRETCRYYDMVFVLDPLTAYEVDTTKATPAVNPAFRLHIHSLIHGAISQVHREVNYAMVPVMPLQERVDHIAQMIVERMNDIDDFRRSEGVH